MLFIKSSVLIAACWILLFSGLIFAGQGNTKKKKQNKEYVIYEEKKGEGKNNSSKQLFSEKRFTYLLCQWDSPINMFQWSPSDAVFAYLWDNDLIYSLINEEKDCLTGQGRSRFFGGSFFLASKSNTFFIRYNRLSYLKNGKECDCFYINDLENLWSKKHYSAHKVTISCLIADKDQSAFVVNDENNRFTLFHYDVKTQSTRWFCLDTQKNGSPRALLLDKKKKSVVILYDSTIEKIIFTSKKRQASLLPAPKGWSKVVRRDDYLLLYSKNEICTMSLKKDNLLELVHDYRLPDGMDCIMCVSPNGKYVVMKKSKELHVYDLKKNSLEQVITCEGEPNRVEWAFHGNYLAVFISEKHGNKGQSVRYVIHFYTPYKKPFYISFGEGDDLTSI